MPATRLRHSIPPYIHVCTPTSRLQGTRASCLHTSTPPHRYTYNALTDIQNSMLSRLHTCSAPLELHTPRRYTCSVSPELQNSIPPHFHDAKHTSTLHTSTSAILQNPIHLYHHIATPAARLQTSRDLRLLISTSPGPHHASSAPCLHVATPTLAFIPDTSIPPCRYNYSEPLAL